MKVDAEQYMIQTVSRALDLLEQFQEGASELSLTDLGTRLKLQKNNVFRLVATLKAKNYIEVNDSTGKYRLGLMTRTLGQIATRQIDFVSQAHPFLVELKRQCHENCYFSVIKDGYTYYIDGVESDLPVRVSHQIGSSRPLYCTAPGRVQVAFMERQKQLELLAGSELKAFTANTIIDNETLRIELEKVIQQGFAIEDQEIDAGVMEIAAPVFDSQGVIIGALSILGPQMRLSGTLLRTELIPLLCANATRLSHLLGFGSVKSAPAEMRIQTPKTKAEIRKLKTKTFTYGGIKGCC
jgi:DNA-binding IclR family transcriptional regulator